MDNFDLEKLLSENYCDTFDTIKSVDKERVYSMYNNKNEMTRVGKRAMSARVVTAVMIVVMLAVGTVGAKAINATLKETIKGRAAENGVYFTDEELERVESSMEPFMMVYDSDLMDNVGADIGENEHGQKYGRYDYGLELVTVGHYDAASDAVDVTGYVYSEDRNDPMLAGPMTDKFWESFEDIDTWEQKKNNGELRNWCYVFDQDGTTIIGKFFIPIPRDVVEVEEKELSWNFVLNEELETGEYDNYLYNGYDSEEYEAMVQARTESLLNK